MLRTLGLALLIGCWSPAPSAQPRVLDVDTMTQAQADIAVECAEALFNQENGLSDDKERERRLFDRYCGAFGYKVPLSAQTSDFDKRHARQLIDRLRQRFENVPSYPSQYAGGVRYPVLFEKVDAAMREAPAPRPARRQPK